MKKFLILLIFLLAFILRLYQLGSNPASLDWDEASLGYNAYSILKTGKDEYGTPWPLSIRSFGDYKPPLYTYLTIIPVSVFGLNEYSTRFISAIFGTLTVIISYFLIKELFSKKSSIFYLLFSIFFALSPWHIQFSRIAFEANLALFFFISGILLFLKGMQRSLYLIFSFLSFGFSMYAYHSPRLVVPLLIIGSHYIFRSDLKKKIIPISLSFLALIIFIFPIFNQLRQSTAARFGSVTVVNPDERLGESIKAIEFDQVRGDLLGKLMHNRRVVYAKEALAGYVDHFNFDFLFLTGDPPGRHHAAGMGMLYFWDLPFVVLGLLGVLGELGKKGNKLLIWWFLVAPVASALTTGTPHAVRALLYLPTYQIFTSIGVIRLLKVLKLLNKSFIKKLIVKAAIFLLFIFNFYYYLHMYYIHTPVEYAEWWQYGYKEVVKEVSKLENNYQKVIETYAYDQPYIYFLFYKIIDPSWYQQNWGEGEIKRSERKFGKYEFRNINWEKDSQLTSVILVGTPGEIPEGSHGIVKEIYFPDQTVAFRIVVR